MYNHWLMVLILVLLLMPLLIKLSILRLILDKNSLIDLLGLMMMNYSLITFLVNCSLMNSALFKFLTSFCL